jgi:hypothetical protein
MSRGLDVLELTPSEHLTANELEAARQARFENRFGEFNPQHQPRITWPASFAVARAYLDQLERASELTEERRGAIAAALDEAEAAGAEARREMLTALVAELEVAVADARDGQRVRNLAAVIRSWPTPDQKHSQKADARRARRHRLRARSASRDTYPSIRDRDITAPYLWGLAIMGRRLVDGSDGSRRLPSRCQKEAG